MPRRPLDLPLALPPLRRDDDTPLAAQLARVLRDAILDGRLAAGCRLPSSRALAVEVAVGRNTVLAAYDLLAADGFIQARGGSGTVVAALPPQLPPAHAPAARPLSRRVAMLMATEGPRGRGGGESLSPGAPDTSHFPWVEWSRLLARRWRRPPAELLLPDNAAGHNGLRAAVAQWLNRSRALRATPEQVMVVSGSQQALDLAARVLLDPGDSVLTEDPCYPGLRGVLRAAGAHVVAVPVDGHGFDAAAAGQWPQARLAFVTPSHQYPTGATMSLPRRLALVEWARTRQGWIVEDDYDADFRHAGPPLAALQGLDGDRRTIHLGTFSKSMFPGLRLGWMVLPPDLVAPFQAARRLADMAPPSLTQAAMADFMAEGHFARHLRRMRALYGERRAAFLAACARHLTPFGTVTPPEAGLHSVLWLRPGTDDRAAAELAGAAGFACPALSGYRLHPGPPGLVLGWGAVAAGRMDTVMARLAEALAEK